MKEGVWASGADDFTAAAFLDPNLDRPLPI